MPTNTITLPDAVIVPTTLEDLKADGTRVIVHFVSNDGTMAEHIGYWHIENDRQSTIGPHLVTNPAVVDQHGVCCWCVPWHRVISIQVLTKVQIPAHYDCPGRPL